MSFLFQMESAILKKIFASGNSHNQINLIGQEERVPHNLLVLDPVKAQQVQEVLFDFISFYKTRFRGESKFEINTLSVNPTLRFDPPPRLSVNPDNH